MSTKDSNISEFNHLTENSGKGLRIGVVKAVWNNEITDALHKGASETLKKHGAEEVCMNVPGAIELTFGAKKMIKRNIFDAIIVLGCVIQGETKHFDYVCNSVTYGVTELNLKYDVPVIFGVLTTDTMAQAKSRAGGELGNKGIDAAIAAIQMADLEFNC